MYAAIPYQTSLPPGLATVETRTEILKYGDICPGCLKDNPGDSYDGWASETWILLEAEEFSGDQLDAIADAGGVIFDSEEEVREWQGGPFIDGRCTSLAVNLDLDLGVPIATFYSTLGALSGAALALERLSGVGWVEVGGEIADGRITPYAMLDYTLSPVCGAHQYRVVVSYPDTTIDVLCEAVGNFGEC
jgi:hypothetical protein